MTHGCLLATTALLFAVIFWAPPVLAFVFGALLHHRIGILLHEYIHGIPFARYRHSLLILTLYEGLLMTFGGLELFRATHLAHHRWLNTPRDPAFHSAASAADERSPWRLFAMLELPQHAVYLSQALRGERPYVRASRVLVGMLLSLGVAAGWIAYGYPWIPAWLLGLALYTTLVSSSLRGAVEHHGHADDQGFANEYRPLLPLFNINRHIHHHVDPTCPWYLLRFQTDEPLPARRSVTHWIDTYVRRRLTLMRPLDSSARRAARSPRRPHETTRRSA